MKTKLRTVVENLTHPNRLRYGGKNSLLDKQLSIHWVCPQSPGNGKKRLLLSLPHSLLACYVVTYPGKPEPSWGSDTRGEVPGGLLYVHRALLALGKWFLF